jgi:type II secretory ATPase GspE/PulE/Tfp pilus assembly ATPase PilB-like protein
VAQRLVRKICEHCKKEIKLPKPAFTDLIKMTDVKKVAALMESQGLKLNANEKNQVYEIECRDYYQQSHFQSTGNQSCTLNFFF